MAGLQEADLAQRVRAGYLTQEQADAELGRSAAPPPPPPAEAPPAAPSPTPSAGGGALSFSPDATQRYIAALKLEAAGQLPPDHQKALDTIRAANQTPPITFAEDDPIFATTTQKYPNLPPGILQGLVKQESGFNPTAVSPTYVTGLAQITKATGKPYGITPSNRTNPWLSVEVAGHHLSDLLDETGGNLDAALRRWNVDDPTFSQKVQRYAATYAKGYVPPSPAAAPAGAPPTGPGAAPLPPGATGTDALGLPIFERPPTAAAQTTTPTTETYGQAWARRVGPFSSQHPGIPEIAGKILTGVGEIPGTAVERLTGSPTLGTVASYLPWGAMGTSVVRKLGGEAVPVVERQIAAAVAKHAATGEQMAEHAAEQAVARQVAARRLTRYSVDAAQAVRDAADRATSAGLLSQESRAAVDQLLHVASSSANRAERLIALRNAESIVGQTVPEVRTLTTATARAGTAAAAAEEKAARLAAQQETIGRRLTSLQQAAAVPSLPARVLKTGLRVGRVLGLPAGAGAAGAALYKWLR
jgi:soluble lytic murein transglycosylase-like protein